MKWASPAAKFVSGGGPSGDALLAIRMHLTTLEELQILLALEVRQEGGKYVEPGLYPHHRFQNIDGVAHLIARNLVWKLTPPGYLCVHVTLPDFSTHLVFEDASKVEGDQSFADFATHPESVAAQDPEIWEAVYSLMHARILATDHLEDARFKEEIKAVARRCLMLPAHRLAQKPNMKEIRYLTSLLLDSLRLGVTLDGDEALKYLDLLRKAEEREIALELP